METFTWRDILRQFQWVSLHLASSNLRPLLRYTYSKFVGVKSQQAEFKSYAGLITLIIVQRLNPFPFSLPLLVTLPHCHVR